MAKAKLDEHSILGLIYSFILALILAFFIGITINTFYPAPKTPAMIEQQNFVKEPTPTQQTELQRADQEFSMKRKDWAQNASIIVISAATVLVGLGLFLAGKMPVLPNGVLLGGLFTIFYGVTMAMSSESRYVIFGVVTASLIIIFLAGYLKFVRNVDKR